MKSRLDQIRSQIESRIPGAFRQYDHSRKATLQTGVADLDQFGIPSGGLTQICAAQGVSSGSTSLMVALLAHFTAQDRSCALVDSSDCFDPAGAEDAGVALNRLLWVRCSASKPGLKPLEQAFKACDILLQNGGFRMIAVDLLDIEVNALRKVPLTTWFRFSRVVERMETSLLFLMPYPAARSCAALTIQASAASARWRNINGLVEAAGDRQSAPHTLVLDSLEFQFEITRDCNRKAPQSTKARFVARSRWA